MENPLPVPTSTIYEVTILEGNSRQTVQVYQSSCPAYQVGRMHMKPVDQHPLKIFNGDSINWASFPLSKPVTVQVRVLDTAKMPLTKPIKIFPTRYGLKPSVNGSVIQFTVNKPGQYSVEIGTDGHKNGLLIFADPPETEKPDPRAGNYFASEKSTPALVESIPAKYSGIYFGRGVHDIGVYHVPANIKNIYLAAGSWVYGAIIMDGQSNVKIFGRGVLSEAKLNYRESHAVEALNHADQIDLEGIVLADTKFFAVRLLGTNNTVKWVKDVGGWTYNTDGIAAFANSTVAHCFIRANDDSIKPYRANVTFSDCVVWQMNNGAVIQLGWGNARATNVVISNLDILHAEWNNNAPNRGVVSCIGDKFAVGGMSGLQQNLLIENLITETPVPFVFNIRPNPASEQEIHGFTCKNWNVKMDASHGWPNAIECASAAKPFDGFVFDNVDFNGIKLTKSNWLSAGHFVTKNMREPSFGILSNTR